MNGLDTKAYEPIFVAVNEEGPLRQLIEPDIAFYSLGRGAGFWRSLPSLYRLLKKLQPDIVISTMAHMNFAALLLKPFFRSARFFVREAITPSYFEQKPLIARTLIYLAYKTLYPRADRVISPAQKIIDEFRDVLKMPLKNSVLLPNPVDVERIRSGGIAATVPKNTVHYICAGRLVHQKGFDDLIKNLPALKQPSNWHLTIIGEGEQREILESLIEENNLAAQVTLTGFKTSPWPLIAGADAFLMPSRYEGLPNTVLEALACGTPVIATQASGGIDEIAQNMQSNSLIITNNIDEFIKAMANVKPQAKENMRPSLLPRCYEKEAVLECFVNLFEK